MGGVDLSQVAKFAIWDWVACWAVDWFGNAMQGHCNVNPIVCLLGDFVLLLISSLYVVGMGDDGTRKKESRSGLQVGDTCRLPKKGKNGGGVDLSQVAEFAIWDWAGMGRVCPR